MGNLHLPDKFCSGCAGGRIWHHTNSGLGLSWTWCCEMYVSSPTVWLDGKSHNMCNCVFEFHLQYRTSTIHTPNTKISLCSVLPAFWQNSKESTWTKTAENTRSSRWQVLGAQETKTKFQACACVSLSENSYLHVEATFRRLSHHLKCEMGSPDLVGFSWDLVDFGRDFASKTREFFDKLKVAERTRNKIIRTTYNGLAERGVGARRVLQCQWFRPLVCLLFCPIRSTGT